MTCVPPAASSRRGIACSGVLRIGSAVAAFALAATAAAGAPASARSAGWIIQEERLTRGFPISVSVVARGRLVYSHAGAIARPPASNEKLLLSMALLDRFGPGYRIATSVEGSPAAQGVVAGDVWLVGHGDPELDDTALERLAVRMKTAGIRAVHGSVVGVTDTFTRERWAPGWQPIAMRFVGLPTALTFDGNSGAGGFVFDPERRAAAALTADLRALGVRVGGPGRAGPEHRRRPVLARIASAPLVDILRRQNVDSLNLDAEVLTKMLGAAAFGAPGSTAKGARAIEAWARRHGVAVVAHDGSGLSYADRITTNGMTQLLSAATSSAWGSAFRSTLPTSGQGTLAGRLAGVRVKAKTGTLLQQVSALSGWVWLERSRRWAEFSILSRGLQKPRAVALEDRVVSIIADNT